MMACCLIRKIDPHKDRGKKEKKKKKRLHSIVTENKQKGKLLDFIWTAGLFTYSTGKLGARRRKIHTYPVCVTGRAGTPNGSLQYCTPSF